MDDRLTITDPARARLLDAALVALARAGDPAALGRLYAHRGGRLLAHARRLTDDAATAQDVAQEAWVEVLRGLPRLADDHAFLPWALAITTRRAARAVRGQVRRRALAAAVAADPPPDTLPDEGGPDRRALRRAIARLPPGQRAVVELAYLDEMPVAEVALALNLPPGTVKTRAMAARATLRAQLNGENDGPT
jgi:RNA polymerase sigma-70 factor (ECF subfamily)